MRLSSTKTCCCMLFVSTTTSVVSAFQNVGIGVPPTKNNILASSSSPSSPSSSSLSFNPFHTKSNPTRQAKSRIPQSSASSSVDNDPIADLSDERKANLFQSLLRDLQIEGVPLLGCDATAVHTMSAALWTTMAELSENDEESKVCLVMESIPVGALKAFEEDFTILKTQGRLMAYLPELKRISVSLIGKGVGPAFVIETTARTEDEIEERKGRSSTNYDEEKCTAALKSFIDRVVVGEEACPYTKNIELAATGLEARGITPGPVAYRFNESSDACAVVGAFWTCVCELLGTPEPELSTTMLSLPAVGTGVDSEALNRFAIVMELVSRNLCLFRGDDVFGLVHFHPAYDRTQIHPIDKPAYGHLPPQGWLRPMMKLNKSSDAAEKMTDEELSLSNYQRRAPFTAINILRVNQLNAAAGPKSIVDLDLGDGVTEKASGITTYSRNAIRLAGVGKEALQAGVDADRAMVQ